MLERGLEEVEGGFRMRRDIRLLLPNLYKISDQDFKVRRAQLQVSNLIGGAGIAIIEHFQSHECKIIMIIFGPFEKGLILGSMCKIRVSSSNFRGI